MSESERSVHSIAIFVDFENLALGFQGRRDRFDIQRVLKRMVEKGKIVVKKAYADWNRYASYTSALHEAAIELIEIPTRAQSGKNSADIRLCVDAMDLAYSKDHIDTFIIVSGDSDFSPLVSKLKELGKHVIGHGMQGSTSDLLRDNCDEFIYYEDLGDEVADLPHIDPNLPEQKKKAFALLMDSLNALRRENKSDLWSSMIKDTMKRKRPSFNETYHGYSSFSLLLEDAERLGLIELAKHHRSGTYVVTRFGDELKQPARPTVADRRPRRRSEGSEPRPRRAMTGVSGDPLPPRPRRRTVDVASPTAGSAPSSANDPRRRPELADDEPPMPRRRREPPELPSLLSERPAPGEALPAQERQPLERPPLARPFGFMSNPPAPPPERSVGERAPMERGERGGERLGSPLSRPPRRAEGEEPLPPRRRAPLPDPEASAERPPRQSEPAVAPPALPPAPEPPPAPQVPPRTFGAGILDD
ncbi:MAG TPA: NYN domain-containing protein [Gemmatales bacterium]|nr:NYN domain-containing protein [Gemmatales bacterium]